MSEVVFFVGPPFGGKTLYYRQHLPSYQRVSAGELYQANPGWGLRAVVQIITKHLRRGQNVVVDDENWSRKTRISYIQNIRAKVPSCKFVCYIFNCSDAFECFWRREWALAKQLSENEDGIAPQPSFMDLQTSETRIEKWFQHQNGNQISGIDAVTNMEGWHKVKDIKTSLRVESHFKFEVPAMFMEWSGVNSVSATELSDALRIWQQHNPCGRMFVLALRDIEVNNEESDSNHSAVEDSYTTLLKNVTETTQVLGKRLRTPVYYLITKDPCQSGSFTTPPKSGILSFLQYLHHLNLHHLGTVYLHQSNTRQPTDFIQSGLNQFAISAVCKNPWLLATCQGGHTSSPAHPSITDIKFVAATKSCAPLVPMYEAINSSDDWSGTYTMDGQWGRVLGVSYTDTQTFERYQEDYADNASRVTDLGTKMDMRPLTQNNGRRTSSSSDHSSFPSEVGLGSSTSASSETGRRDLPAWLRPKKSKKSVDDNEEKKEKEEEEETKKGLDKLLGSVSPHKTKGSREKMGGDKQVNLPRTIYCMTVAELREVAKLFLEQGDEIADGESLADVASDAPPPNSVQPKHNLAGDKKEEHIQEKEAEEGECLEREDDERRDRIKDGKEKVLQSGDDDGDDGDDDNNDDDDDAEDGVASIITDLFMGDGEHRKPPPRKKTIWSPKLDSATTCSEDEESMDCTPFQVYDSPRLQHHSNPRHDREITKTSRLQGSIPRTISEDCTIVSGKKRPNQPTPDLSFLDDIF